MASSIPPAWPCSGRRGGALHASHMTSRTADGVDAENIESRGTTSHSLRGSSRFAGRGRSSTFHAFRNSPHSDPVETLNVQNPVADITVTQSLVIVESPKVNPLDLKSSSSLDPHAIALSDSLGQFAAPPSPRDSPPPIPPIR